jgi:uncharacterized protein
MARITVKVHPRARVSAVTGRWGEAYKLALAAPPVNGKANDECIRFLAELAGVHRARIRIVSGQTARLKLIEIDGIGQQELEKQLAAGLDLTGETQRRGGKNR